MLLCYLSCAELCCCVVLCQICCDKLPQRACRTAEAQLESPAAAHRRRHLSQFSEFGNQCQHCGPLQVISQALLEGQTTPQNNASESKSYDSPGLDEQTLQNNTPLALRSPFDSVVVHERVRLQPLW